MKTKKIVKERNEYLDILRGIAIFLMVWGHCIQYGNGLEFSKPEMFFNNFLFKFIYSFHMPLFMLISGYVFAYTVRKHNKIHSFLLNRFWRILLPIASWQIVNCLKYLVKPQAEERWILVYLMSLPKEFWFLWAIFYCSIAIWVGRYVFKDNILWYFWGFAMTFFVPEVVPNMKYYEFLYPFFVGGYLWNEKRDERNWNKIDNRMQTIILLVFLLIYVFLMHFWNYDSYIYTSGYTLLWREEPLHQFGIDIYRMFVGFAGSTVMMLGIKLIYEKKRQKQKCEKWVIFIEHILAELGKKSLGIYIISGQLVGTLLIANIQYFSCNYFVNLIQTAIIIGISYLITYWIGKNTILDGMFLGGRN